MSRLPQALPPDADVTHTWILDSTAELQGLRAALSSALHGPEAAGMGRLGDVPERMVLVATELATNAIRHGLAPTEVRLMRAGDMFLLDVTDHDPDTAPEPADASAEDMGGRGLALAQSFSVDVGWYCTPLTKHVWATFANTP
jgi:serine/threonine-protein kinase RsbW